MKLSICIPNFNRADHLNNCLNSILISSKNIKNLKFEVCISDNNSNENITNIVKKYESLIDIKFKKNKKNLGFALNAIESVKMAQGSYAWLIGNDDLLLPETLSELEKIFEENSDVEYFFINSYFLHSDKLKNFAKPVNTKEISTNDLKSICNLSIDKRCSFWEVIDPKVTWDFLIGIFLSVFKREKWLKNIHILNEDDIKDTTPWSNFDNTCIHPKLLSKSFKDSKSYICSKPLSINLIGEREWASLYEFIEIVRIPELIKYYRSEGLPFWKYLYCKNYSLRNFLNFFLKILIGGKKSGLHLVDFRVHFLSNLIYPNSYLSFFYYFLRLFKSKINF